MMTAVAALCLAFTARAHAGAYEYSAAKVQIDVPGGWLAAEADGVLTVQASDGSVAIVIATMDAKDAKTGAAALDKQVAAFIPDASLAKAKAAEVNGLKGYMRRGTGTLDGAPVEMGILVLLTPSKQVIMVMALGATGQYEVHGDAMNAALASISPIRLTMPQAFYDELGDAKGTAAVKALLKAIDDNDSAALSKLFAKEFSYYGTSTKGAYR